MGGIVDMPAAARPWNAEVRRESFYLGIGSPYAEGGDSRELQAAQVRPPDPEEGRDEPGDGVLSVPVERVDAMLVALDEVTAWMRRGLTRDAGCRSTSLDRVVAILDGTGARLRPQADSRILDALAERGLAARDGDVWRSTAAREWNVSRQGDALVVMGPVITFGIGKRLEATQAVELLYRDLSGLRAAVAGAMAPA